MDVSSPLGVPKVFAEEARRLSRYWGWFLALGVAMIVLGTVAISWSCLATITVTATWIFGFLLSVSGFSAIFNAFRAGRWSGTLLHLLVGIMYVVVGFMVIEDPAKAAIQLTLIIAVFLIVSGILRMVFAISERFPGWVWVLLNGVVTLVLGIMIYKQWPASGLWVIGLFIGIDLILNGWAWVMLALMVKRLRGLPQAAQPGLETA